MHSLPRALPWVMSAGVVVGRISLYQFEAADKATGAGLA
jgi:hypothetical protein